MCNPQGDVLSLLPIPYSCSVKSCIYTHIRGVAFGDWVLPQVRVQQFKKAMTKEVLKKGIFPSMRHTAKFLVSNKLIP